jgi:gas vesicle protein
MAKNSNSKWALGALFAGIAGFLAGILTAPKSGKETREDIKHAAVKAKTEAEKTLKSLHSDLNKTISDVRAKGDELSGKAKDEFEEIVEKAKVAKEKVRDVLSTMHDGNPDDPDLKKALKDGQDALKSLGKFVASEPKKK